MGNKGLSLCKQLDNFGAKGAYAQFQAGTHLALLKAINEAISFVRMTGGGQGSSKAITTEWPRTRALIASQYRTFTGRNMDDWIEETDDELKRLWENCRKKGYKALAREMAIRTDYRPLLEGIEENGGGVIYCYLGRITSQKRRVVKIGWTSGPLKQYLARLRRAHDPELLGFTPGTREQEKTLHASLKQYLSDGKEWYTPSHGLFLFIRTRFNTIMPTFEPLVSECLAAENRQEP